MKEASRYIEKIKRPCLKEGDLMDLQQVREKWVNHDQEMIDQFIKHLSDEKKLNANKEKDYREKLEYFAIDFLLDFESEIEEDPENEDGGIITLETVTAGYIDSFLGRWLIQKSDRASEKIIKDYQTVFKLFYDYLKENKLYKEGAAQFKKLMNRVEHKKKYVKRIKDYLEIQEEKGDEEKYLDLMREWEYEDLY